MKWLLLGPVAGIAAFLLGVVVARLNQQTAPQTALQIEEQAAKRAEIVQYQSELNDATPNQLGILTKRQRVHSRLCPRYGDKMGSIIKPLNELANSARAAGHVTAGVHVNVDFGSIGSQRPADFFTTLARASDAIILGRVTQKTSQLTEDNTFIFTDYDVLVSEVIKSNVAGLGSGTVITVTRPGGKVLLEGVIVTASIDTLLPFSINEGDMVLFLRFIPETGAYEAAKDHGSFELRNDSVRTLSGHSLPTGVIQDRDSFLATVHTVSAR
jgi:hypothetical protein